MRYFLTSAALKPVTVSGRSFKFEPVGTWGGSWFGVLATADEAEANILADGTCPVVEEITETQYQAKKKATSLSPSDSPASTRPPQGSQQLGVIADRAGSTSPTFEVNGGPNSTEKITRLTILTTGRQPPSEPILEGPGTRRRW